MRFLTALITSLFIAIGASAQGEANLNEFERITNHRGHLVWRCFVEDRRPMCDLIDDIGREITITEIVGNIVLGRVDGYAFCTYPMPLNGQLPLDASLYNALVVYEFIEDGYIVTVSRIYYRHTSVDQYFGPIEHLIYRDNGEERQRAKYDYKYLDRVFSDNFILKGE